MGLKPIAASLLFCKKRPFRLSQSPLHKVCEHKMRNLILTECRIPFPLPAHLWQFDYGIILQIQILYDKNDVSRESSFLELNTCEKSRAGGRAHLEELEVAYLFRYSREDIVIQKKASEPSAVAYRIVKLPHSVIAVVSG